MGFFCSKAERDEEDQQRYQAMMASAVEVQRKLVVMGFRAVGKSSLTTQFVDGHFIENYDPTIENTFRTSVRMKKVTFTCDILDTAGQDEYSSISRQASVGVHGYLLVYSVTSRSSLEQLKMIHDKLLNLIGAETVPSVLVGSKCDLNEFRDVSSEEGQELADSWGCPFIECSAKQNLRITESFNTLLREVEKDSGLLEVEEEKGCVIL